MQPALDLPDKHRLARLGVNFCDGRFEPDEPFYRDSTFLLAIFDSMGCTAEAVRRIPMQPRDSFAAVKTKQGFGPKSIFTQDSRSGARGKLQYLSEKGLIKREPSGYSQSRAVAIRWVRRRTDSEQGNRGDNHVRTVCRAKWRGHFQHPRPHDSPHRAERTFHPGRSGHQHDPGTCSGHAETLRRASPPFATDLTSKSTLDPRSLAAAPGNSPSQQSGYNLVYPRFLNTEVLLSH